VHRLFSAAAALLLAVAPATAAPGKATPASKRGAPAAKPAALALPALERFTLANGLEVAFLRAENAPLVSVHVWYHAGAKDEARDRRGSAHMFEHMMFKGTARVRPEEHARHVNRLGGYVNAATTEDATFYFQTLPAQYLDFALQLEAERMRSLLFRDDMISTEREVVKEEIRQQENNPLAKGYLRFLEVAYTAHPYAWTAGGTIADLDATTPADLQRFYDTYYVPNNALVVVVGNTTLDEVRASVEKHFGALPRGATPPRPADAAREPEQAQARREVVEPGQVGLVIAGYKIPEARHVDVYALQVLSLVLGNGESSRLAQRIKRLDPKTRRPLGVQGAAQVLVREHPGLLALIGAFLDPASAEAVERALMEEVDALAAKGPTADELRKAKNQIQAGFVFGLESADGLAQQIGQSWILTGDPGQFMRDVDELEKVTAEDIKRVAATYLTRARSTVVVIPPAAPQ
jgi:zinc protease